MRERLRQLEMVGCGAMAQVFRGALHGEHGTSRPVAIKRLRPELRGDPVAVDLFVNEAKIAVRLNHANVVHALELAHDEDGYALVCEWLECTSLQEMLDRGRLLPPFAVVHVGRCLCNALDYLHQLTGDDGEPLGLVHRDVTPANVFVTRAGEVKLTDFGAAWRKEDPGAVIAGTPDFAAPEQQQSADLDGRADIYGLGATLRAVAAELPADLVATLDKACAADRQERFPNAKAFATALEESPARRSSVSGQQRLAELWVDPQADPRHAPRLDAPVQAILGDALTSDGDSAAAPVLQRPRRGFLRHVAAGFAAVSLVALVWQLNRRAEVEPVVSPKPAVTLVEPDTEVAGAGPSGVGEQTEPEAQVAPSPVPERPVAVRGTVNLNATPWARVKIDGREVGNTPLKGILLAAGRHTITLFNPPQNLHRKIVIEVDANQGQTFVVDLRRGIVRKRHEDDRS